MDETVWGTSNDKDASAWIHVLVSPFPCLCNNNNNNHNNNHNNTTHERTARTDK